MTPELNAQSWAVIDHHDKCRGIDLTHAEALTLSKRIGNATVVTSDTARRLNFAAAEEEHVLVGIGADRFYRCGFYRVTVEPAVDRDTCRRCGAALTDEAKPKKEAG